MTGENHNQLQTLIARKDDLMAEQQRLELRSPSWTRALKLRALITKLIDKLAALSLKRDKSRRSSTDHHPATATGHDTASTACPAGAATKPASAPAPHHASTASNKGVMRNCRSFQQLNAWDNCMFQRFCATEQINIYSCAYHNNSLRHKKPPFQTLLLN